ncbi:MAG: hypothetical protein IPK66_00100 [Rhodospirillales bacterium]|nr:hypothetical protein [Rhodospirillales bacterium]
MTMGFAPSLRRPIALGFATVGVFFATLTAEASDHLAVDAKVTDVSVAVTASAQVHAPFAIIWQTLTDYDHLAEFIPGMNSSRVIERFGTGAIVEQEGNAGNSFLSYPIDVVIESDEYPPSTITAKIVSGNIRALDGAYHIQKVAGAENENEFVLSWNGPIRPDIDLPDFIAEWAIRQNIRDQFRSMIDEIERRARAANQS